MTLKVSAMNLALEDKRVLVNLARRAIRDILDGKSFDEIDEGSLPENLKVDKGVFVTLYKNHELRGCLGYVLPLIPLWRATLENACNAAFRDHRFEPLHENEYDDVTIEISVLNELEKIKDVHKYRVGTHGIILKKGLHVAVILPQVPLRNGWNALETLRHLSEKAGLEPGGWKESDSLEIFTAEVFSESELVPAG
ncbi:MAG TPA: AmmeMemoRadiSam system protein A [Deltaproteobacteria bacterium]|nr:AmmeMemoRadiSam system protein A [Deltaproteobacteria bacterium]